MRDSTQAEALITATLVQRPDMLDDITLSHDDFLDAQYGLAYRAIRWLHESGKNVNTVTVMDKLANRLDNDHMLSVCDATIAQSWAVKDFAKSILDSSMRRKLIKAAHFMMELAETAERIDDGAMAEIEKAFNEVSATTDQGIGLTLMSDLLPEHLLKLDERQQNRDRLIGANTGFAKLNYTIGGWQPGDLCIVGARPSMGKTAFALETANKVAEFDVAAFFSLEMMSERLLDRMTAADAFVPLYNILHGRLTESHLDAIHGATVRMERKQLYIDDNPNMTTAYIRRELRKLRRKAPPEKKIVAFVDYMQIVKLSRRGRSRNEEIAEISQEFKGIAKELGICVVALAQLNRSVESRQDKRPNMGDLRDSGQIEQDADVIMLLYRDEYYNKETQKPGVVEVIVAKNRNGEAGTVPISFAIEYQKFVDFDKEDGADDKRTTGT